MLFESRCQPLPALLLFPVVHQQCDSQATRRLMEPSTRKKSVDEIWKELNSAARAPAVPKSSTTGIPGFGIPGVQTRTRILPSKSQQHPEKFSQHFSCHLDASRDKNQQQHLAKTASLQTPAAAPSQEGLSQYLATLQRTINCLSDPDRSTRRSAIDSLATKIFKGDGTTPKASTAQLQVGGNIGCVQASPRTARAVQPPTC